MASKLQRQIVRDYLQSRADTEQQRAAGATEPGSSSSGSWIQSTFQRFLPKQQPTPGGTKVEVKEEEVDFGVNCLRRATATYPQLAGIPMYVKYNRAKESTVLVGDQMQDVDLFDGRMMWPTTLKKLVGASPVAGAYNGIIYSLKNYSLYGYSAFFLSLHSLIKISH